MNRSVGMLKMMALADFLTRAGRMIGHNTAVALLAGLMVMEAGCGADPDAALPGLSGDASVDRQLDAESERADRATDRSDAAADPPEEPTGLGDTDSSIEDQRGEQEVSADRADGSEAADTLGDGSGGLADLSIDSLDANDANDDTVDSADAVLDASGEMDGGRDVGAESPDAGDAGSDASLDAAIDAPGSEAGLADRDADSAVDATPRDADTSANDVLDAAFVCTPNPTPTQCRAGTPQFCNPAGQWQDRAQGPCPPTTPACNAGACVAPVVARIIAGAFHTCVLFDVGQIKCWGANYTGQLGRGNTVPLGANPADMGPGLPFVDLGPATKVTLASLGTDFGCVRLTSGDVKCWGRSPDGELGLGRVAPLGAQPGEMGAALPTLDLGSGLTLKALDCQNAQACALFENGQVKCWGNNFNGRLGQDDTAHRGDQPGEMGANLPPIRGVSATAIAVGGGHACAILDNGSLKCWGTNFSGQLGLGDTAHRGDAPGEMDALLPVNLGSGRSVKTVAAGDAHTCIILDTDELKCWGMNNHGQLGLGSPGDRGDSNDETPMQLPVIGLGAGRRATAISLGDAHTCALLDNGKVKCWGNNAFGQLGYSDTRNRGLLPADTPDLLPEIDLGSGRTAASVAAGGFRTCALLDNGQIKCWGINNWGLLGLADTEIRGDGVDVNGLPIMDMGDNLPPVVVW